MTNAEPLPGRRVLAVFAHPDDEIFCAGGTIAKWAAEGAAVTVLCATRGEAGQIRDAAVATRRTLGEVREAELRLACARLGVGAVEILHHRDGTLRELDPGLLAGEVGAVLDRIDPDVVITFGEDGAYGHPDHIAIGAATAAAVAARWSQQHGERPLLLRSHFPMSRLSLAERLAAWLFGMKDVYDGSADYGRNLTLFAQESTTMRFASDDVRIVWSPPGTIIVEQGEPATSLALILSGNVDVFEEIGDDGERRHLRTLSEGQFFGELGVAQGRPRSATVVAIDNVTCLVLSPTAPTKHDGRGGGAAASASPGDATETAADDRVLCIDVAGYVGVKLSALAAHRTQYPIDIDVFPRSMLEEMYGLEYFLPVPPVGASPFPPAAKRAQ